MNPGLRFTQRNVKAMLSQRNRYAGSIHAHANCLKSACGMRTAILNVRKSSSMRTVRHQSCLVSPRIAGVKKKKSSEDAPWPQEYVKKSPHAGHQREETVCLTRNYVVTLHTVEPENEDRLSCRNVRRSEMSEMSAMLIRHPAPDNHEGPHA